MKGNIMDYIIDSIDLESRDGFDLRASIVPDDHCGDTPDGDYTDEQIDAYRAGDWRYVGLIVTASRAGIDLGSDSLWAVEEGVYPTAGGERIVIDPLGQDGSLSYYGEDMIGNAIADARMTLASLIDEAIDSNIDAGSEV